MLKHDSSAPIEEMGEASAPAEKKLISLLHRGSGTLV
jgi:hypothetical protein